MHRRMRERINVSKVSGYAIFANSLQILVAAGILAYALFAPGFTLSGPGEKLLIGLMTLVVVWGAALDIREAFSARRIARQSSMIEDALSQLEELNGTLRAQRHDFMNHLQVVYSLTEMQEYAAAQEYIERVYGDIQRVGKTLKTAIPAVNALLAAKASDCEDDGISMELDIRSAWQDMPMPGWEMCRILGNLIDNARDALLHTPAEKRSCDGMRIRIEIGEDVQNFSFAVINNGPGIPPELREDIFRMGFTTKSSGRGMGLHIVSELMQEYDGTIRLECSDGETRFCGTLPRRPLQDKNAE